MVFSATLLTPEGPVIQQEVARLHLPGIDGELDILAQHTPLILSLAPGVVSFHAEYKRSAQDGHFFIWGGLAHIRLQETMLLVSRVCPLFELNQADLEKQRDDLSRAFAQERLLEKKDDLQKEIEVIQAQIEALNRYDLMQFHFLSGSSRHEYDH